MKLWHQEGVVSMKDGHILVRDEKELRKISERDDRKLGRRG